MPTKPIDSQSATSVPVEYAGKWVAWNSDHARIVAHSDSMQTLWHLVRSERIPDPIFEKIPRADVRFVGML